MTKPAQLPLVVDLAPPRLAPPSPPVLPIRAPKRPAARSRRSFIKDHPAPADPMLARFWIRNGWSIEKIAAELGTTKHQVKRALGALANEIAMRRR